MIDRKKVIEGFECCSVKQSCLECPWVGIDCNDRLHLAALELLKEQDDKDTNVLGKWISVEDKLPEIRRAVLCYSPYCKNAWALTLHEDGDWYYWIPMRKKYDPEFEGPITHWMPLPEPPKEVSKDES